MKIPVQDLKGAAQGEVEVPFALIENGKGTQAVHEVVVAYRAAQRSGTACTKTVGEVAGSNKKPWRQKGTGRARAGSVRSPLWRGGGVVFGPKPRSFAKKTNAKVRSLALRKALSERIRMGDVLVVEDLKVQAPKTKNAVGLIEGLSLTGTTLFVTEQINKELYLAARNLQEVEVTSADLLNTYQVLRPDKLVVSKAALARIGERLKRK
ncbi:MAG TPA: 50S ribosomal protein L4 [Verrucomicrobiales bacterium]|nr:50S ribosomal protein L4 [Verrucomicrobiales bacterium]